MAIASITAWLNDPGRTYNNGKLLYEQYGTDKVLLTLLKSGSGSYHLSKLTAGLALLNKETNLVPKPIVINEVFLPAPAAPGKASPDYDKAPEQIRIIRDNKNLEFAQARKLFEVIRVLDSQEHRLAAGLEILDRMDRVNEAWEAIDQWQQTGKLTELKIKEVDRSIAELRLAELLKEERNIPPNISKYRKKLADAKQPKKQAEFAQRLQWLEHRLDKVKRRLHELV